MKIIEIIVSPQGETAIQTKGFAGASCRDATRALEQTLGVVQSDKPTAEMYQVESAKQRVNQGGG